MYKKLISSCCHKEVIYDASCVPSTCPHCGNPYWNKPNDEFYLFMVQDEFIKNNRDIQILWNKAYFKMVEYAKKIIQKKVRSSAFSMKWEELSEIATNTVIDLIDKYHRIKDYKIEGSFFGALNNIALAYLYNIKKQFEDSVLRYEDLRKDENNDDRDPLDKLAHTNHTDVFKLSLNEELGYIRDDFIAYLNKQCFIKEIHLCNMFLWFITHNSNMLYEYEEEYNVNQFDLKPMISIIKDNLEG